jgi:uncharacterized delta-60 repeat protein
MNLKILIVACILVLGCAFCGNLLAQPGQLDPSFGLGGWQHTDLGGKEQGGTADIQADGKILAGGRIALQTSSYDFLLVRYLENGQIDSTFGNGGFRSWDFGLQQENLEFVKVLGNGKILVGGFSGPNPNSTGILMRLLPDGMEDSSFANNGVLRLQYGRSTGPIAAAVDAQGRIVVTGVCVVDSFDIDWFVSRFTPDGAPDSTFNGSGWMYHNFLTREDIPFDIKIEPTGHIFVTGCAGVYPKANFAFLRLRPEGTRDPDFGSNGSMETDFAGNQDVAYGTAITADGKYFVSGTVRDSVTNYDFGLARYHRNGDLDASFGKGGLLTYDLGGPVDYGLYLIRQPDDKYLVCGENNKLTQNRFVVMRYLVSGAVDTSFGNRGMASFDAVNILTDHTPHFAMQKDGKVVMVANYKDGPNTNLLLMRWLNDIAVDLGDVDGTGTDLVRAWPNPTANQLVLIFEEGLIEREVQLECRDISGRSLGHVVKPSGQNRMEWDVFNGKIANAGLYFIRWISGTDRGAIPIQVH